MSEPMTDADVIAWARRYALACSRTGNPVSAERYRRLADLAEKGATLLDCGQDGVCATAPGCVRHWAERNRELVAERAAEDWQPIATAPLDGSQVLFVAHGDVYQGRWDKREGMWRSARGLLFGIATHWRHLPAPPGGER